MPIPEKKTCFVVSPIGEEGSPERAHAKEFLDLVTKALHENYSIKRADMDHRTGVLIGQIIQDIDQADLIVVDLCGHNPNVLYEVGIAHFLAKPIVQMIPSTEKPRFDISGIRSFQYSMEGRAKRARFVETLRKAAAANQDIKADNPIIQALPEKNVGAMMARIRELEVAAQKMVVVHQTQADVLERERQYAVMASEERLADLREKLARVEEKRLLAEQERDELRSKHRQALDELAELRKQPKPKIAAKISFPFLDPKVIDAAMSTQSSLTPEEENLARRFFKKNGPKLGKTSSDTEQRFVNELVTRKQQGHWKVLTKVVLDTLLMII